MLKFLLSAKGIVLPVSTVERPLQGAGRCRMVMNRLHQNVSKRTTNFLRIFRILHQIRHISAVERTVKSGLDLGMDGYRGNRAAAERGGLSRTGCGKPTPGQPEALPGSKNESGQRAISRRCTKCATAPDPSTKQPLITEATGKLNASAAYPSHGAAEASGGLDSRRSRTAPIHHMASVSPKRAESSAPGRGFTPSVASRAHNRRTRRTAIRPLRALRRHENGVHGEAGRVRARRTQRRSASKPGNSPFSRRRIPNPLCIPKVHPRERVRTRRCHRMPEPAAHAAGRTWCRSSNGVR